MPHEATLDLSLTVLASAPPLLSYYLNGQNTSDEVSTMSGLGVQMTAVSQYGDNSSPWTYSPPSAASIGNRRLIVGLGPASTANLQTIARSLVSSGNPDAIIRYCWEMNGNWFNWGINGGSLGWDAATFVASWINAYQTMKAIAPDLLFCWNFNGGTNIPTAAYPGDQYVDIIASDQYDYNGYQNSNAAFVSFAKAHGKPMAFGEWGLGVAVSNGGLSPTDNPAYIDAMAQLILGGGFLFHVYFAGHTPISAFPTAEQAFSQDFG